VTAAAEALRRPATDAPPLQGVSHLAFGLSGPADAVARTHS
jgi:hypothetical protein